MQTTLQKNQHNFLHDPTERAVQRAEKKLQIEYDKQMELKRKAADQRFKVRILKHFELLSGFTLTFIEK
jgi:hypothetical protein